MTDVAGAAATAHILTDKGPDGRVEAAEAHGECANCGADLQGAYCHRCGQKAHLHSRLRHLVEEMIEGIAHLDGRLWRTLPLLAFRPGRLSRAWMDGKRARYVAPLHVFLFAVFLLFLIPSFTGRHLIDLRGMIGDNPAPAAGAPATGAPATSASAGGAVRIYRGDEGVRVTASEVPAQPGTRQPTFQDDDVPDFIKRLETRWNKAKKNPEFYGYKIEALAYKLSFVIVPISMGILGLLLVFKRGYSFYDHGVVALYGIGFFVLMLAVGSLFAGEGARWARRVIGFAAPVHAVVHLHGAYRLSWFGSVLRGIFLGVFSLIGYLLFLGGVFALGLLA